MKKWITITTLVICLCFCLSPIVHAEDDESESVIIDFSFGIMAVTDENYARIQTDYPKEELRYLKFKYINFSGEEQKGEIIINHHVEFDVLDALQDLYYANCPLEEIEFFVGDGFDVAFIAPMNLEQPEDDPYNQAFGQFDFAWNENQANGIRHYTISHKIAEWYP